MAAVDIQAEERNIFDVVITLQKMPGIGLLHTKLNALRSRGN